MHSRSDALAIEEFAASKPCGSGLRDSSAVPPRGRLLRPSMRRPLCRRERPWPPNPNEGQSRRLLPGWFELRGRPTRRALSCSPSSADLQAGRLSPQSGPGHNPLRIGGPGLPGGGRLYLGGFSTPPRTDSAVGLSSKDAGADGTGLGFPQRRRGGRNGARFPPVVLRRSYAPRSGRPGRGADRASPNGPGFPG